DGDEETAARDQERVEETAARDGCAPRWSTEWRAGPHAESARDGEANGPDAEAIERRWRRAPGVERRQRDEPDHRRCDERERAPKQRRVHASAALTASRSHEFSSGVPTVMRMQPASRPASNRRTRTPRSTSASCSARASLARTSRKLPPDG